MKKTTSIKKIKHGAIQENMWLDRDKLVLVITQEAPVNFIIESSNPVANGVSVNWYLRACDRCPGLPDMLLSEAQLLDVLSCNMEFDSATTIEE